MPRILLAEDSWENVAYVTALLEGLACVVDTAANGRQAIDLFESGKYAVVLMDCQMPVMDGFEATRLLRAIEARHAWQPALVVALTANAIAGVKERCLACGMDAVLIKPFTPESLLAALGSRVSPVGSG
ncbi:MAG TPA: response regulator [Rubrivivax sp.]|nr:response regulator [Rubrivivax sp.]